MVQGTANMAAGMLAGPVRVGVHEVPTRRRELLRLITCGSVDDGKSTLIGRLLYDTKSIHQDQWEAIHRTSLKRGDARVDLALLTDGLRAEREQGITIDVAYRYFSTPRRSFIMADTPGHVQYTRNMATGASTADAALILVDARQGVIEQTRRHAYIATLLGVSHLVLCVNKMDLVGWDKGVFDTIVSDFQRGMAGVLSSRDCELLAIPVSALHGDNIVGRSQNTAWYTGASLLDHIETMPARPVHEQSQARLPVQWVCRPQDDRHHDYRAACGMMASGTLRVGDEVVVLPTGVRTTIARLHIGERELESCGVGMSVSVVLKDDVCVSRGDMIVRAGEQGFGEQGVGVSSPRVTKEFEADVVWMSEQALSTGRTYLIKHASKYVKAKIADVRGKVNLQTLEMQMGADGGVAGLGMNDIGRVNVRAAGAIVCDAYRDCRGTGSFIVIDEVSNNTVGAGMIV